MLYKHIPLSEVELFGGIAMLNALWVLLPSILAGFTQTVTGFGGGIVVMLFFSALSQRDRGDQPQLLYDDLDQSGAVLEIPPFYLLEGDAAALRHLSAGERGCHLSFHAGGCGFHESLAGAFSGGGGSGFIFFRKKFICASIRRRRCCA